MFKELYFLRWGIECKYKELKSSLEIEEFSGKKPITIKQDFYASIYLSMLASMVKNQSDKELDFTVNTTKYKYQANRNFILNRVFKYLIDMLIHHRKCKKIMREIVENAKKVRSHIGPNSTYERKNKHPCKGSLLNKILLIIQLDNKRFHFLSGFIKYTTFYKNCE